MRRTRPRREILLYLRFTCRGLRFITRKTLRLRSIFYSKRTSLARPQYEGKGSVASSCYPFKFTFKNKALLAAMQKLGNFDRDHVNIVGDQPTWFLDQVKLLIFVPVNDCKYATKISPKLRKTRDFTNRGGLDMLLLYLRPLPYELEFHQRKDDTVFIYIN